MQKYVALREYIPCPVFLDVVMCFNEQFWFVTLCLSVSSVNAYLLTVHCILVSCPWLSPVSWFLVAFTWQQYFSYINVVI